MAPTIVYVIIVSVVLHASLSLPILVQLEIKQRESASEEIPKLYDEIKLTESASEEIPKLNDEIKLTGSASEEIPKLNDIIELLQSLSAVTSLNDLPSVEAEHKRVTRDIVKIPKTCPEDRILYGGQCLTPERMAEYNEDYGSDDYKDYEAER